MSQIKGKQIASGSIAADRLDLSDSYAFTGSVTASNPSSSSQVATKAYVDSTVTGGQAGLDFKESVRVASDASLSSSNSSTSFTYSAGVISEDSAATSTLLVDGVSLALGNRILLKNESNAIHNGIYEITQAGDGSSTTWELTRASDADSSADLTAGAFVFAEAGSVNANRSYVLQAVSGADPTLDTDNLNWIQYSGAGQISTGTGLTKSGDELQLDFTNLSTVANGGFSASNDFFVTVDASGNEEKLGMANWLQWSVGNGNYGLERSSLTGFLTVKAHNGITVSSNGVAAALPQRDSGSVASDISTDDTATGITISDAPAAGSNIRVTVNGVGVELGNGTTSGDAYFTNGSGGARAFSAVVSGDELYWNGNVSGAGSFALETTDIVEIFYNA